MNDHLQGKKHKAKETSLRTQKIGKDTKTLILSLKKLDKCLKSIEVVVTMNLGLDSRPDW